MIGQGFEELDEALTQMHAAMAAIHQSFLELVATLDGQREWTKDSASTTAGWLSLRFGVTRALALKWVNSARALASLALARDAYGQGQITFEHVLALIPVAKPDNEQKIVEAAKRMDAAHFATWCKSLVEVSDEKAKQQASRRSFQHWWSKDYSWLLLRGKLPAAEGAVVEKALHLLAEQADPCPVTGDYEPYEARAADALVQISSGYLDSKGDADRACVVLHVEADALREAASGTAVLENGPAVAGTVARRVSCDAVLETVLEGADHKPLGIGRRSRKVPAWLLRQLRHRDKCCRFPGCDRTRWVHAHHVKHWADGGPTDAENLVLLCGAHHRLVHEGGWSIRGHPEDFLEFIHPGGQKAVGLPPPGMNPEVRQWVNRVFQPALPALGR